MENIRIKFSKTGGAKYISHLDLNRFFQRMFKRSGIPVWYTEGFNPHIYLHFLLPLSLGTESVSELVDLKLTEHMDYSEVKTRLNSVLPNGFEVLSVNEPKNKPTEIAKCCYEMLFEETDKDELLKFLGLSEIPVLKKTKRKEFTVDLKKEMEELKISETDGKPSIKVVLSSVETHMINPELIVTAFSEFSGRDVFCRIKRTAVLSADGSIFE